MNISDIGEFGFIRAIQDHTIVTPETVTVGIGDDGAVYKTCLLYTSPSPRDISGSRMPSSA